MREVGSIRKDIELFKVMLSRAGNTVDRMYIQRAIASLYMDISRLEVERIQKGMMYK